MCAELKSVCGRAPLQDRQWPRAACRLPPLKLENSTLQWRVDFARLVLKLELQVRPRLKRKGWRWRPGRTDPAVGVEGGRSSPRLSSRPLVQTQECVRSHCLKKDPSSVRIVSRIARSCNSPRALLLFLSMRHLESSRVLYI
eukprot:6172381-Pleurochrysis_carterae.AAC.2